MTPRIEHLAEGVTQRALEIWRAREMQFPAFVRRMKPDALDMVSGAWIRVVVEAQLDAPDMFIEKPKPAKQEQML